MADLRFGRYDEHGRLHDGPTPEQVDDINAAIDLLAGMTAMDGTNYLDIFREAYGLDQQ